MASRDRTRLGVAPMRATSYSSEASCGRPIGELVSVKVCCACAVGFVLPRYLFTNCRGMGDSVSNSQAASTAKKGQSDTKRKVVDHKMSESHFDEYEHYNFEYDKHIYSGHSGKQRSKKEAESHTNHTDASGHTRKIVTKMQNTEQNRKQEGGSKAGPRS